MDWRLIIGQEPLKKQLTELVQQNRLSHALLFIGKEGAGALPVATAFAQYLVCERYMSTSLAEPCGSCPACKKAAELVHPDIHPSAALALPLVVGGCRAPFLLA